MKDLFYSDRLGRQRVLVEVPKLPPPGPQVDLAHEHYFQLPEAPPVHLKHHHTVDLDDPEHIHRLPRGTSYARYTEAHLKGARQSIGSTPDSAA